MHNIIFSKIMLQLRFFWHKIRKTFRNLLTKRVRMYLQNASINNMLIFDEKPKH